MKKVDNFKETPDLIIIDPSRDRIYLRVFIERGYKINKVRYIDMFPRIRHVGSIILMISCTSEAKK